MKRESARNLEREVSARFGVPAPTLYSKFGNAPAIALSRLSCAEYGHGPSKPVEPEDAYVLHVMVRDVETYDLQLKGRRVVRSPAQRGSVFLGELRHQPVANFSTPFDLMRIYVDQAALDEHASASGMSGRATLHMDRQGSADPILSRLQSAVIPIFDKKFDHGQLFVDSMSLAIQDHLLHAYGKRPSEARSASGGLAPWLERRAKDFLESRIADGTSLEEVAEHCGLSPSHFSKSFRTCTGRPPHRWLLERRIEASKPLLMDENISLASVATSCGFSDASHFSRTFSQLTREPPAAWRRRNRS